MQSKIKVVLSLVILSFIFFISIKNSFASGIDKLVEYASQDGSMSNINSPEIIKDQAGGYMTGGSILLRGPRPKELQPFNIQTPRLRFDACTGSGDFRFGSLSYISAGEFSTFLKNVATASGAYLVKMSIKTACPQCEDIMTYLETVARDVNSFMFNQCSMAQNIASGAFSKLVSKEKQHCMMTKNASDRKARDMFDATQDCQDKAGTKNNSDGPEFESLLGDEFNLVWKALSQGVGADSNFKELMMSVSGTIIGKKEDGRYKFSYKPSLLQDKELLERYIGTNNGASKIKLYSCDGDKKKCLNPSEIETTLKPEQTLYGNIAKIFRKLVVRVRDDDPKLTDEEQALVSFSSIPILNLIEMELSMKARTEDLIIRVPEFVEVICYDVITTYMEKMLARVMTNVKNLEHAQIDDVVIRNFIQDAETVRNYLRDAKFGAFQKLQVIMQVKERLNNQTKEFEFSFGKLLRDMEI